MQISRRVKSNIILHHTVSCRTITATVEITAQLAMNVEAMKMTTAIETTETRSISGTDKQDRGEEIMAGADKIDGMAKDTVEEEVVA